MFSLLVILSLFSASTAPLSPSAKTLLTVDIQNIRLQKGAVYVALFREGTEFPEGKPTESKKINVAGNSAQTTFSVDPGEYAIAVLHDENGNGKMDKRAFGIPKEPYGFSNNFRPKLSAPKFSDCQFHIGDASKAISIQLN